MIMIQEVLMTEMSFLGEQDFLKTYLVPYFFKVSRMHCEWIHLIKSLIVYKNY